MKFNDYIYISNNFLLCSTIFTQYFLCLRGNKLETINLKKINDMDVKIASIETKLIFLARKYN